MLTGSHESADEGVCVQEGSPGRRILHGVGGALSWLALVLAALGQLVAWTSPQWWVPVLQWAPTQYVVLAAGIVRDALGAWTVVTAALLLAVALLLRSDESRSRALRPAPILALVVLVSSTALWTHQVRDARAEGVDVAWFTPTVPFTEDTVDPDEEVVVGTAGGTDLVADLYLPDGADTGTGDPFPVVVRVHGGGFTSGAPRPRPYYPPLLDRGVAVLDVSYRLASPDRQTWDAAIADVGCALTWVTAGGTSRGLDPERVGLLGDSAGGQLAINAANQTSRGTLEPSCGDAADLPDVRAVAATYPTVDGSTAYAQTALGAAYGDQYVGGSPEEFPGRYVATDSVTHLGPDGAPLLIVQGGADHLILPGPVRRFAELSREAGTTTRFVELPGQDHTFGGRLSFGHRVARDLATEWFTRHL